MICWIVTQVNDSCVTWPALNLRRCDAGPGDMLGLDWLGICGTGTLVSSSSKSIFLILRIVWRIRRKRMGRWPACGDLPKRMRKCVRRGKRRRRMRGRPAVWGACHNVDFCNNRERRQSMSAAGLDGVKAHHETAWPVGNRRTVWKRGPCGDPRRVGSNRIKDSENQIELLGLVSVSDTFDSAGGAQRLIRMDRSITCGKPECSSHGTFRSRREEEGF